MRREGRKKKKEARGARAAEAEKKKKETLAYKNGLGRDKKLAARNCSLALTTVFG